MKYSLCLSAIVAAAYGAALPAVSQIADGQIQEPTGMPVSQISEIQEPTGMPVQQISDGQIQEQTGMPVQQISDGQIQEPQATGMPVAQISDGQIQAPTGMPVQQISDGQVQAMGSASVSSSYSYPTPEAYYPFKFPLSNGFPNVTIPSAELTSIFKQAHGTLPNGALPKQISDASATTLQVIAFNEIFEVSYFTSLLHNLTSGVYNPDNKDYVIEAITAVQGQEQLHALGANAILESAGRTPIQACEYTYPVSDYKYAIYIAARFTDLVLGALQGAAGTFCSTGDGELVPLIGAIIGNEGEQDGFYRSIGMNGPPSALPFLSADAGVFLYSALNQIFVVEGSCGNSEVIDVPILRPLNVINPPSNADSYVTFTYPVDPDVKSREYLRFVYLNQQNVPIVQELQNLTVADGIVTITQPWPYSEYELNGLTIAAITNGSTTFSNISEVAAAALWGPGLIEVN